MSLAYGMGKVQMVGSAPVNRLLGCSGLAWSKILPEKYNIPRRSFWKSISDIYEGAESKSKGLKAASDFVRKSRK